MDFVAIGVNQNEFCSELMQVLKNECPSNLYLKLTEGSNMDPEVAKGVIHLSKYKSLTIVQYEIKDETVFTSNNLGQDLIKPFMEEGNSIFLEYLESIQSRLPNIYYLIFGFEWHESDRVRYISLKSDEVNDYFLNHSGWHLMLYSIENNMYFPDLDVPLIIEVNNNQEA